MDRISILTPAWSSLCSIYDGVVGKSLFLLSLTPIFVGFAKIGLDLSLFKWTIIGAILAAIGHVCSKILCPKLVKEFPGAESYALSRLNLYDKSALEFTSEFQILNQVNSSFICTACLFPKEYIGFFPISKTGGCTLDKPQAAYLFAKATYRVTDLQSVWLRILLTASLAFGLALIYKNLITNVMRVVSQ